MKTTMKGGLAAAVIALNLCVAAVASAQTETQTTAVRNFEIISVEGNSLVVRDQLGTRELTVPADFRFTVDGRSLAVSDLKAGMKGTATVTTTTTVRPVYVTTIKNGKVLSQVARSVVVREEDGTVRRFTQSEADARNVKLYMDGKPIQIDDLEKGDVLAATIVTAAAPEVLTTQQVDAVLANPDAPLAAPVETTVDADSQESPAAAEAAPEAATADTVAAPDSASPFEDLPKPYFKRPFFWLLVLVIAVAFVWVVGRRKVEKPLQ